MQDPLVIGLFFFIALVYSSAGFGGGSLYLAVLSASGMAPAPLRLVALFCNLIVTGTGSFTHFLFHQNRVREKIFFLVLAAAPFAFWSSTIALDNRTFFLVLGAALLAAGSLLFLPKYRPIEVAERTPWWLYPLASGVGTVAGMTGIGGGVYLAPVLYMTRWGDERSISTACSLFIFINSLAGIGGAAYAGKWTSPWEYEYLFIAVLLGGVIGSGMNAVRLPLRTIRRITGGLLIFAGLRILWQHF